MGAIVRGVKNAFRNTVRTSGVVVILSISICLSLVMLLSLRAVQEKIADVKSNIGNTISVSPAGMRGMEGSGNLLTSDNVAAVEAIENVASVVSSLSARLTTDTDTNLEASIQQGNFGGGQPPTADTTTETATESRPSPMSSITVTGTDSDNFATVLEASDFSVTAGVAIDVTADVDQAMLGSDLADENELEVGDTFTMYDTTITVVGIYDSGTTFNNGGLVMSLASLQCLSSQDGVSSLTVTTTSVDTQSTVADAIESALGDTVDVTTSEDQIETAVSSLESIKTIALYGLIGCLAAGAIITFLTMMMIVRERRREIGVLKAIGASNAVVTGQFVVESLVLTLMASVIGIIGGFLFSNPILSALVSNSSSSSSTTSGAASAAGRGGMEMMKSMGNTLQNNFTNLQATVGLDTILYGLLAAIAIAVIGSAVPAYLIAKIRPAEVMRND